MEKTDKSLTKEEGIVDMQVIDQQGRLVGKVKDLSLAVGKSGLSLSVENASGETQKISWESVQAVSDFILLKAPPAPALSEQEVVEQKEELQQKPVQTEVKKESAQPLCPTCGKPLKWIPQYSRWYCYKDKKYV